MIALHLPRVYDAEIASHVGVAYIGPLELLVFCLCEVGHGPLQFCDNMAGVERACSEDAKLGFPGAVRIAGRVRDFDGPGGVV